MPVEVTLFLQPTQKLPSEGVGAVLAGKGSLEAAYPGFPLQEWQQVSLEERQVWPSAFLSQLRGGSGGVLWQGRVVSPQWVTDREMSQEVSAPERTQERAEWWGAGNHNIRRDSKRMRFLIPQKAEKQLFLMAALEWFLGKTTALSLGYQDGLGLSWIIWRSCKISFTEISGHGRAVHSNCQGTAGHPC